MSRSSQRLVDFTCMPANCRARRSSTGESGLKSVSSFSTSTLLSTSSFAGRSPARGCGPSNSSSSASWRAASSGSPKCCISQAMSAPALSAASKRPSRAGSADAATAARCNIHSATGSASATGSGSSRSKSAVPRSRGASVGAVASHGPGWARARSESAVRLECRSIAWLSLRSTQRSTRRPAPRSAGYQRRVSSQTKRAVGCSATKAASSPVLSSLTAAPSSE